MNRSIIYLLMTSWASNAFSTDQNTFFVSEEKVHFVGIHVAISNPQRSTPYGEPIIQINLKFPTIAHANPLNGRQISIPISEDVTSDFMYEIAQDFPMTRSLYQHLLTQVGYEIIENSGAVGYKNKCQVTEGWEAGTIKDVVRVLYTFNFSFSKPIDLPKSCLLTLVHRDSK